MDPYIGEIRLFGGNYAPNGWQLCDGRLMSIIENQALYALIGTIYGGDGVNNFALPDLRSRVPMHIGSGAGSNTQLGERGGVETVTLLANQTAAHTHQLQASTGPASSATPVSTMLLAAPLATSVLPYGSDNPLEPLSSASIGNSGVASAHENIQPYLSITYIIALTGIYPS